jgi:hypothetical protein
VVLGVAPDEAGPDRSAVALSRVLYSIVRAVERAEAEFSATAEQDNAAVARGKLGYDEWVTLSTRARFKRILSRLRHAAEHRLALSQKSAGGGGGGGSGADAASKRGVELGSAALWGGPPVENIVHHLADDGVLLTGDVALREALFHLRITL